MALQDISKCVHNVFTLSDEIILRYLSGVFMIDQSTKISKTLLNLNNSHG